MNEKSSLAVDLAQVAKNLIVMREHRSSYFPSEIFDEQAWNMLLHLFVQQVSEKDTSENDLYHLADVSPAVGKRWIAHLIKDGQFSLDDDANTIRLTDDAFERMSAFLASEGLKRIRD